MDEKRAIDVLREEYGEEAIEGIEHMLAHKVVAFAKRVEAAHAERAAILPELRERIRQAAKRSTEEVREFREASLMS